MFEEKVLRSVAMQLMNGEEVVLDDQKLTVKRVGSGRLLTTSCARTELPFARSANAANSAADSLSIPASANIPHWQ